MHTESSEFNWYNFTLSIPSISIRDNMFIDVQLQ